MKKILLVAAVAGLAMTSCKKDYTCECSTSSNMPGYPTSSSSGATGKMKKADAEAKCNAGDKTYTQVDPTTGTTYNYTSECNIK